VLYPKGLKVFLFVVSLPCLVMHSPLQERKNESKADPLRLSGATRNMGFAAEHTPNQEPATRYLPSADWLGHCRQVAQLWRDVAEIRDNGLGEDLTRQFVVGLTFDNKPEVQRISAWSVPVVFHEQADLSPTQVEEVRYRECLASSLELHKKP